NKTEKRKKDKYQQSIDSFDDFASDKSISENSHNKKRKREKKSVGKPEDPINNKYIKLGQPNEMKSYLVLRYKNISENVKTKYLYMLTNSQSSKKTKIEIEAKNQPKITDKFQSIYIDQSQEKLINNALTHFFTC
ncbi:10735_t:CDS:2, partial [Racocetra persica]